MMAASSDTSVVSLLLALVLVSVCLYLWSFTRWHYWKLHGVPYLKPVLPVLGNMYDIMLLKSLPEIVNRIYRETRDLPYVGIYAFHTPVLFVRDLDIAAKMLVNDFSHFVDRGFHYNTGDSIGRNLIHQNGQDWKFSRSRLSQCFNVNKVKSMLPTMLLKSKVLLETLEKEQSCDSVAEAWDISLRYTTDVVIQCTLGVDSDCLQNSKDQFLEVSRHILKLHFIFHIFTGCFIPWLHKLLGISVAKARVTRFFHSAIHQIISYRRGNQSEKKDLMQVLLQLQDETSVTGVDKSIQEIDDNFIVAQAFGFFFAGFETPGNTIACTLFEIAKNAQIQEALHVEITHVLKKFNGEVTFEALQDMKYLRQTVSESLRKYPPLSLIFRRCTKDYKIPDTSTVVDKGTLVLIPMISIHHDPQYYPDPEIFEPERFSEENSATRHSAAYMPFGIGPRFCPAVLYSHIKMRTALVYILRQYEVGLAASSMSNIEASPVHFLFAPKNGIPLTFKRRTI